MTFINDNDNGNPLQGSNGVDEIRGNGGDDIINPLQSDRALGIGDIVDGGQGYDTLVIDASAASVGVTAGTDTDNAGFVIFFLRSNNTGPGPYFFVERASGMQNVNLTGGGGGDILVGLTQTDNFVPGDEIDGRGGNDKIYGAGGLDIMTGGDDFDELYGGGGKDYFYASQGSDYFDGGSEADTVDFRLFDPNATGAVVATLAKGWAKFEKLTGRDNFYSFKSIEILITGNSDDVLVGNKHNNGFSSFGGIDSVHGGDGNDIIIGGDGGDFLFGDNDHDDIDGGSGNDRILGGNGNDEIQGSYGSDRITGGLGKDIMRGSEVSGEGEGANDVFVFRDRLDSKVGARRDIILDFNGDDFDKIDLSGIDANRNNSGNQKFAFFVTDKFHDRAQELLYKAGSLKGDTNGDGKADFEIFLQGAPELLKFDIKL